MTFRLLSAAALVLAACGSKDAPPSAGSAQPADATVPRLDAPPPDAASEPPPVMIAPPVHEAPAAGVSRERLLSHLHASAHVMGFDLEHLNVAPILRGFLDTRPCLVRVLANTPSAVVGIGRTRSIEMLIANLPITNRQCLAMFAINFGVQASTKDGGLSLTVGTTIVRAAWKDDLVHVTGPGAKPRGALSRNLEAQIARVPADAGFWFVSSGLPARNIGPISLWLRGDGDHVVVEATVEGAKPDVAAPWLHEMVEGLRATLAPRGVTLPVSSADITDNGKTARIEARIPMSTFVPPPP